MAVAPTDLLQPKGPVSMSMFPGKPSNVLEADLDTYITRASTDTRIVTEPDATKTDRLVRSLALHLIFQDAYVEMNMRPLTVQVTEKGGHGFSTEQIRNMRELANQYLTEFTAILTPVAAATRRGLNASVATRFTF